MSESRQQVGGGPERACEGESAAAAAGGVQGARASARARAEQKGCGGGRRRSHRASLR